MTGAGAPALPPFVRLARLLDRGLFAEAPSEDFRALIPQRDSDWEDLFLTAKSNRALAPLSYLFAARPAFGGLAGDDELAAMQDWHAALSFRSGEIRKQIVELAGLFAQHGQRFMLLKGAARMFDDLYPDISCRYSIDIDPLIEDPSIFYETFPLGYDAYDDAAFDMNSIRAGDISVATGPAFHHLPPLYRGGDQASVELHLKPFATKFDDLAIPGLWADSRPVPGLPAALLPSVPHQIIINIIHSLHHGLAKEYFSISMRDLLEGHLLYAGATERQRADVAEHFSDRGHGADFELWCYLCSRIFEAPIYPLKDSLRHRRFFDRLTRTQADPKAKFRLRFSSKLKEMLFKELWNRELLKIRLRHLASAAFWRRLAGQLRHSRQRRK